MIEKAKITREELNLKLFAEERELLEKENFEKLKSLNRPVLDEDGYPTDHALNLVKTWYWDDIEGWFKFIETIWYLKSWGWSEVDEQHEFRKDDIVHRYYVSTAGWSGNESIIKAMQLNCLLWDSSWVESRRGGHYIFELGE